VVEKFEKWKELEEEATSHTSVKPLTSLKGLKVITSSTLLFCL